MPALFVATREFVDGAQVQARALGVDPAAVYVEHPIQDRSDEEMLAIADGAWEAIFSQLVAPEGEKNGES